MAVTDLNVGGGSGVELCVLVTEVDVAVVGYSSSVLTSLGPQQSTLCVWICYHCGVESVPPVESRQCHHTPDVATPLKDPPVDNSVLKYSTLQILGPRLHSIKLYKSAHSIASTLSDTTWKTLRRFSTLTC